jgi:hypothetical protein
LFTELDVDTSFRSYKDYYEKTDWGAKQVQPDLIYQLFSIPEEGEYKTHTHSWTRRSTGPRVLLNVFPGKHTHPRVPSHFATPTSDGGGGEGGGLAQQNHPV